MCCLRGGTAVTTAHAQKGHLGEGCGLATAWDHYGVKWREVVMEEEELCQSAGRETRGKRSYHVPCFRCWRTRIPPPWLVVCAAILVQVFVILLYLYNKIMILILIKDLLLEVSGVSG